MIATGNILNNWQIKKEFDFFVLKADIITLCQRLGIEDLEFSPSENDLFKPTESADIKFKANLIGRIGKIKEEIISNFDIKSNPSVFYAEIFLDKCSPYINLDRKFRPLSPFPSISRDISIIVKQSVRYSDIVVVIKEIAKDLLRNLKLVDIYKGKQIPEGSKSMTLSLEYGLDDRTLTDIEIAEIQNKIITALTEKLEVKIR